MTNQASEILEKIRQQYESCPYPRIPLEKSPKDDLNALFIHNLVTSYYLRYQKFTETKGKVILDAGCGSGYKSLMLAEANPEAKIVGIDISEESVKLARHRLEHHGFENAEFHVLSIYDLPSLGMEFDYINNDETLYLLPDPIAALKTMKSVLKPFGMIRTNLHSALQRAGYFRAQKLFGAMGLTESNPGDLEAEIILETMKSLKDGVDIKSRTWHPGFEGEEGKQSVFMNYLLQSDNGFTIPEMFAMLRASDLEFTSMVNWRHWELTDLFKEPDNLPVFLGMTLPEINVEQRLHLFELLHPCHRLLDFWCGYPNPEEPVVPVAEWSESDWLNGRVHLHPVLQKPKVKEDLIECITEQRSFRLSDYIRVPTNRPVEIESTIAACILPLWEGVQPITSLVERWSKIRPLHPVTLEPVSEEAAWNEVKKLLCKLEVFLYVLLERSA
ncbi:class I SAM-dependent methyltransferase [Iningainema tapete]|uniref:Methyltransferase domain-containing protein n=1 Tax=Iningainema tapete BLCC-T55 TaxID=2748662 RepID=A0A8J6XIK9_9CYAN|nr:methyltransferase domain-containing protein [Iningainema tapete]MBD2773427.1 methyltransferase domain-containing protein [Iningainema tapete BLCC-T55]